LGIIWVALYFPQVYGSTGLSVSRMEINNNGVRDFLKVQDIGWTLNLLTIFMLYLLSFLPFPLPLSSNFAYPAYLERSDKR